MIYTYYVNLPTRVKSFVTEDEDGNYIVYVNYNLTHEEALRAYLHEIDHINNGDLDKDGESVQELR